MQDMNNTIIKAVFEEIKSIGQNIVTEGFIEIEDVISLKRIYDECESQEESFDLIKSYIEEKVYDFIFENICKEDIEEDPDGVFQNILNYICDIFDKEHITESVVKRGYVQDGIIDWNYIQCLLNSII